MMVVVFLLCTFGSSHPHFFVCFFFLKGEGGCLLRVFFPYEYHMDLCNECGHPAGLSSCVAKTLSWTLHVSSSTKLVHTCHVYRHDWLLPFCTTFTDLDLAWGSQGQCKAKSIGFIFSHTYQLINDQDKIWCGDEAVQAEHPETTFE